jgi:hypothetical protein
VKKCRRGDQGEVLLPTLLSLCSSVTRGEVLLALLVLLVVHLCDKVCMLQLSMPTPPTYPHCADINAQHSQSLGL